jgi:NAD(P)-dependent dehydrogenase (short-subunit alcohol dehydrogenase family)
MEQDTALIIGAGRAHNAPLIATLREAGFCVRFVARCGDILRDDERNSGVRIEHADVQRLERLMAQFNGALRSVERINLIIYDAGFTHDLLIDQYEPHRIDDRIAEIRTGAMTASICAAAALATTSSGLFVMLGFAESFRNHPGYRRFARGPTAGFDVAQALADHETPFKIAYIGLDSEERQSPHPGLGELILTLWRQAYPLPRWRYERNDLV